MLNISKLFTSTKDCRFTLTNYVSVRWKGRPGKPFWLGLAKTKMFVIPEQKVYPPDHAAEWERLTTVYNRQMRALLKFMGANVHYQFEKSQTIDISNDIKEGKLLNERWNAESAKLREARLKREEEERTEFILNKLTKRTERLKNIEAKVEEIVKKELELSKTYITEENLDEVIDKCLASVSDYNYAIDLSGNIYKGDSMVPNGKMKPVNDPNEMVLGDTNPTEKEVTQNP